jgi:DNA-directed RNA polymerase I subunit RPA1
VYAVLQQYGVEAARATLLAEVRAVFGAYGIGVDPRHLSLIADAMTHGGAYRPCSRAGLDSCPSPLLKMSFETATAFLTDATLRGATDDLHAPSSRIVLGRVVDLGTGACGLHFDLPRAQQLHAERLAAAV